MPGAEREGSPGTELAPEIRELVERSAALPRGLAFVHLAPLESVAAALGAHPGLVERARAGLARSEERPRLIQEFARAVERRREAPPAPAEGWEWTPPRGPEELLAAARLHPLGLEFLLRAPAETAAVAFTVHPRVVFGAREMVARAGAEAPSRAPSTPPSLPDVLGEQ